MNKSLNILVVEDSKADFLLIERQLKENGLRARCRQVATPAQLDNAVEAGGWDAVLSDYRVPELKFEDYLRLLQDRLPEVPVIMVSGTIGEEKAVELLKLGLAGFVLKENLARLPAVLARSLREAEEILLRRAAENALRLSEERFRIATENANDVVYEWDLRQSLQWVGKFDEMLGYAPGEFPRTFDGWAAAVHPDDRKFVQAAVQAHLKNRTPYATEYRVREKSGEYRWWSARGAATRDPGGNPVRWIGTITDITKRKQTEIALQHSEKYFRALTDHSLDIVSVVDAAGKFSYESPSVERVLGWKPEEHVGQNAFTWIHPDDIALVQALFESKVPVAGAFGTSEFRFRHKDGSWHVLEAVGRNLLHEPAVAGIVINSRDITARKDAEQNLKLFRTLIERSTDAIYVLNPTTGRFLDLNESGCQDLAYTRDEILALTVFDVTVDLDRARFDAGNALLRQVGHSTQEILHRRKDGSIYPVEVSLSFVQLDREYLLSIVRNITERKKAETSLREQNEIIVNAHEGVMIVSLTGKVLFWNRGAQNIFGWTAAEAVGRAPDTLLGVTNPEVVPAMLAALTREGHWEGEVRTLDRDGRKRVVESRVTLVRNEAGEPRAHLNFLTDITEKKLLEEKFYHAQRLENLGMLAAGIAHDLNNVLGPIMMVAPLLRGSLLSARDTHLLGMLEQSAARAAGLVKQVVGFAQSTTGEFQATQVKHLARDIISMIEETFPKGIALQHQILANLWPVHGSPTQLHQVLLNLCVNARDAMPAGGTLSIKTSNARLDAAQACELSGARAGAWTVIEVSDTGTGIAPEVLGHIWDPFFTTKGAGKGTGLGLATVRGIVENHHGFIDLHTEVGRGTTFRVFLPAIVDEAEKTSTVAPFTIFAGCGERVLVVDDDTAFRETVVSILNENGYLVNGCSNGAEALKSFTEQSNRISLVVTDLDMPVMGGLALARALLHHRPDISIIAMSGLSPGTSGDTDVDEIRKLAKVLLLKPFKAEDLLAAVHRQLHPPVKGAAS